MSSKFDRPGLYKVIMSEKQQMIQLLEAMLGANNDARANAETSLTNAAVASPDQFVLLNLDVIEDLSIPTNVRSSSIIVLKKVLSLYSESGSKTYLALSDSVREQFRRRILIALSQIKEAVLRDKIADLIAEVASSILTEDSLQENQKWPNLVQHLFELYSTGATESILSVFRILEGLFTYVAHSLVQFKEQFLKLFESGFAHTTIDVKVASLECVTALVQTLKPKDVRIYKPLSVQMLQTIMILIESQNEDLLTVAIGCIFDICESEPAFLKQRFDDLLVVMTKARGFTQDPDSSLKTEAVESLVFMIERYPGLIKESPARLEAVLELIFLNMMDVDDEVGAEWCSPPDGFNDDLEEDDDQKIVKVGMDFIDRLINQLGNEVMLKKLSDCIGRLLAQDNWKMRHAAIMALSQVGEYMESKIDEVSPILDVLLNFTNDPNPRIRYACCHCTGQFADDLAPEFQEKFHAKFFQVVLPRLEDNVPRVVAHALASLTNFLENSKKEHVAPHFQYLYTKIMHWIVNGIGYVKEACLSTLSALCEGSQELFHGVYDDVMRVIFDIFAGATKAEFKQLRGNAIECATIIGKVCGEQKLAPYQHRLIEEMIRIQNHDVTLNGHDPQKSYLLAGWQRICLTLNQAFTPYLDQIIPHLLAIAEAPLKAGGDKAVKTYDAEEAEIAVQTISVFLENLGNGLGKFVNDIYRLLSIIIENSIVEDTRMAALNCLPNLVKIARSTGVDLSSFSKHVVVKLWALMDTETDTGSLCEFAFAMQKIIKYSGPIFNDAELLQFYEKCVEHLKKSDERKKTAHESYDQEEENQVDLNEFVNNEQEAEDDFMLEVANLFGMIFRSHKAASLSLFQVVYTNLIIPALSNPNPKSQQFALFLIDDSVEHIGEFLSKEILVSFLQTVCGFTLSPVLELRQCSLFGVGIIALALRENFHPFFEETVKHLTQAVEIPKKEDENNRQFSTVKENAISSFGKVIHIVGSTLPAERLQMYLRYWVTHLPIIHDQKEAPGQHSMLVTALQTNPNLIINNEPAAMKHVVEIFAKIYKKEKFSNATLDEGIQNVVKSLATNEQNRALLATCNLNAAEQTFVQNLIQ